MKKISIILLFSFFMVFIAPYHGEIAADLDNERQDTDINTIMDEDPYEDGLLDYPTAYYEGKILDVQEKTIEDPERINQGFSDTMQVVTLKILNGPFKGQGHTIEHFNLGNAAYDIWVSRGDHVQLFAELTQDKSDIVNIYISDFVRWPQLRNLALIFILLILVIGKWQGLKALIALGATALAVVSFMLPLMLKGSSPILLAIGVCFFSTIITILLVAGFSIKSLTTILGTLSGVLIAGFLSFIVGNAVKLTGLSAQEAQMLMFIPQAVQFDFRGLLFAGIIIGALGAVMDVSMSISSAMDEIRLKTPGLPIKELVKSGITVGRDVMGTMSNTLILAYTGSAIPLLLLFMAYDSSLVNIFNMDLIATEVVRALTGSIGLLSSIPITAFSYGLLYRRRHSNIES